MQLSTTAQRVLGALLEKALTTPDGYPLSLNALRTACNQKTARDPVTSLLDEEVQGGIGELKEHGLVLTRYASGSRVPKYAHLVDEKLDFSVAQQAVIGVLLLRGPQTVGEVNSRTGRMHDFAALGEVEDTLTSLAEHKFGTFVERLPRAPGQKEERWKHLLGPLAAAASSPTAGSAPAADPAELESLRDEVERLRARNAELEAELTELRRQLDELTAP